MFRVKHAPQAAEESASKLLRIRRDSTRTQRSKHARKTALTSRYATKSQMTFTKKTTSTTMVMGLAMAPPFSEKLFEPR